MRNIPIYMVLFHQYNTIGHHIGSPRIQREVFKSREEALDSLVDEYDIVDDDLRNDINESNMVVLETNDAMDLISKNIENDPENIFEYGLDTASIIKLFISAPLKD